MALCARGLEGSRLVEEDLLTRSQTADWSAERSSGSPCEVTSAVGVCPLTGLGSTGESAGRAWLAPSSPVNTLSTLSPAPKSLGASQAHPNSCGLLGQTSLDSGSHCGLDFCLPVPSPVDRQGQWRPDTNEEPSQKVLSSPPQLLPGLGTAVGLIWAQKLSCYILTLLPVSWVTLASHLPSLCLFPHL